MPVVGGVAVNDRVAGVRVGRWLTAPFSLRGLSGFALWGFVLLSVLATGLGFADLRAAGTDTGELSILELAITIALTLFVVSAMVVALHHMVEPGRAWWTRIVAFVFYLIFAIWSVGFGYGFFWKELSGQEFTSRQIVSVTGDMASAVERASAAATAAETATLEASQTARARANDLRALHAEAFTARLTQLAHEVGADPARPGSPDPSRGGDPGYCWDVVLNEKLIAPAAKVDAVEDVTLPPFEFLEGPKATRAAFFGLIAWLASAVGIDIAGDEQFVFDDKAFLALFASIAVDLGIVFLTLMRVAGQGGGRSRPARGLERPTPPRLASIFEER